MLLSTFSFFLLTSFATCAPLFHDRSISPAHKRFYSSRKTLNRARSSTFVHLSDPPKVSLARLAVRNEHNSHLHPLMLYQQHVNKANRRHALLTARAPPSDEELENRMHKRWMSITGSTLEQSKQKLKLRKRQRGGHAIADAQTSGPNRLVGGKAGGRKFKGIKSQPKGSNLAADTAPLANANGFPEADLTAETQNTVTNATQPTAAQTVGENIEANDIGYFTEIQLGTPPKTYNVLLDSGSADLWVPGEDCTSCGSTHTTLGNKTSSTFVATSTPWSIQFGTGTVSGTLAKDNVDIAGLKLANHPFGVTTTESVDFSDPSVPFDGLMGLAKSQLSEQKQLTPIEAMAQQGVTATSQMGFHLGRVSDGVNDGEATFGGVDSTKFTGDLIEVANVSPLGFWEAAMSDITVNGASLNLAGRTAILDTGTTLMIVPSSDATAIHAQIPGSASDGQGGFAVPCNNTAVVALAFNGTSFNINPADLAFVPVNNNQLNGLCVSAIGAGTIGGPNEWLVGDTFLKNVYFATDVKNNVIGLAPAVNAVKTV